MASPSSPRKAAATTRYIMLSALALWLLALLAGPPPTPLPHPALDYAAGEGETAMAGKTIRGAPPPPGTPFTIARHPAAQQSAQIAVAGGACGPGGPRLPGLGAHACNPMLCLSQPPLAAGASAPAAQQPPQPPAVDVSLAAFAPVPDAYAGACVPATGGQVGPLLRGGTAAGRGAGLNSSWRGGGSAPEAPPPDVSVVLLMRGDAQQAAQCVLEVLRTAGEARSVEVVVAASGPLPPEDAEQLRHLDAALSGAFGLPLTVLPSAQPLSYVAALQRGAAAAGGRLVAVLSSSVLVLPGWLHALQHTLARDASVGLAGALLLAPGGAPVDAGTLLWADGQLQQLADGPPVTHLRQVDAVSSQCFLMRRDTLLSQVAGLSPMHDLGPYAAADLGMAVQSQGLGVYVQPYARAIQLPDSGTDGMLGLHSKLLFRRRWGPELLALRSCTRPAGPGAVAPTPHSHTRVFWADMMTPEQDHDSGSVRAANLLAILLRHGYHVTFAPMTHRAEGDKYADWARFQGVQVLPMMQPSSWPLGRPSGAGGPPICAYDLIIISRFWLHQRAAAAIAQHCPHTPVILDTVDLHFLRGARVLAAEGSGGAAGAGGAWQFGAQHDASQLVAWLERASGRQAAYIRDAMRFELAAMRASRMTFVVSESEQQLLAGLLPADVRVRVVSNAVDLAASPAVADSGLAASGRGGSVADGPQQAAPAAAGRDALGGCGAGGHWQRRSGLLFVGSFEHIPNQQAMRTLVHDVLPLLASLLPAPAASQLVLHAVGANGSPADADWLAASPVPVVVHGWLSDAQLQLLYGRVRVVVAPLLSGAGVKGKVCQAQAAGVPVVVTPIAGEGMHLLDGHNARVATSPQQFAQRTAELYSNCTLWAGLAGQGLVNVRRHFSLQAAEGALLGALAELGLAPQQRRQQGAEPASAAVVGHALASCAG